MKRAMFPPAVLAVLILLIAGASLAAQTKYKSSRMDMSDADKAADQQADATDWLENEDDWGGEERARHRELRDLSWRAGSGTLDVDPGHNGGVHVTGWGRDSIRVVAKVVGWSRTMERAKEIVREIRIVQQDGVLTVEGPSNTQNWSVNFDVLAPRKTPLKLQAHNGPVGAVDMDSRMELETVNGPLTLAGVAGDVQARTENGPLTVKLTGSTWRGTGLDASTENGPVMLKVPRNYSCELETGTINGPLQLNIPITVQGRINFRQQHLNAKLGKGGPMVRAVTTNGPANIAYSEPKQTSY